MQNQNEGNRLESKANDDIVAYAKIVFSGLFFSGAIAGTKMAIKTEICDGSPMVAQLNTCAFFNTIDEVVNSSVTGTASIVG